MMEHQHEWVHEGIHCLICDACADSEARIAELEAELSAIKEERALWIQPWRSRAEKAEAEVERLKKELKWAHRELNKVYPHLTFPDLIEGVNPSGDTLGRKERDDG